MAGPTGTPPPLLPGVMRMAITFTDGVTDGTNILHFLLHETGGLGASDVSTMVGDLGGFFINDLWKQKASHLATSTQVAATYALIEGEPNVQRVKIADAVIGLVGTSMDYANVCYLINWATGDARRGGKPRNYLYGVPQAVALNSAGPDSTTLAAINAGITTFLGHVAGHTVGALVCDHLVEYSTVNNGAFRGTGVTFPITTGTASLEVGTQRRRVDRLRS